MIDKTIRAVDQSKCTGCMACYNKCPQKAIEMESNFEGFWYPVVGSDCINCGLCKKACPVHSPIKLSKNPKCYAVWADIETRDKSSSGGMFTMLAKEILNAGGIVFGAAYTEDYSAVIFVSAEEEKELNPIRGSKYVQSYIGKAYQQVKNNLDLDRLVLFTGCPCQIAGLYTFLGKNYANLYTADIICHGVPSPKIYKSYLNEKSCGRQIAKVDFREKEYWGWGTATSLFFSDGSNYRENCYDDLYWKGFLNGVITRKSCGNCVYSKPERVGDFTIGDFWGISTIDSSCDDKRGTSLVLVNTDKAKKLFSKMSTKCDLSKEQMLSDVTELAKTRNGNLLHPTKAHVDRDKFFEYANKMPFTDAYNHSVGRKKYDIGYVGWWDSKNYGSALTSFALNRVLRKMGYSVLMLEHRGIIPREKYDSYGIQFAQHFYDISKITTEKNFSRFNDVCDTFLVGSDQLWNWWCIKDLGFSFFFLDFVNKNHKKIAYATSFGSSWSSFPENQRIRVSYFLNRFDAISVREKSGVSICKRDFNSNAEWVLDPVFLCDKESYDEAISLSKKKEAEPYVFAYILDPTEDKLNAVKHVASEQKLSYRIAVDGLGDRVNLQKLLNSDSNIISDLRIEDWLYYIKNSNYIVTDSFHGFCFSVIFNKQAIAFVNSHRGKARFDSIADVTGLGEYIIESSDQIVSRELLTKKIDYITVNNRLAPFIEYSMDWLKMALESEKKYPSVTELQLWKCLEQEKKISELRTEIENLKEKMDLQDKLLKEENCTTVTPETNDNQSFLNKIKRFIYKANYK